MRFRAALVRRGEHILVFPGGAREVFKHKGKACRLIWKQRFGFVQLAIERDYTITPYATAAAEEAFDVLLDSGDYVSTPLGRCLIRGREDDPDVLRRARNRVRRSLEQRIKPVRAHRARAPRDRGLRGMLNRLQCATFAVRTCRRISVSPH